MKVETKICVVKQKSGDEPMRVKGKRVVSKWFKVLQVELAE